MTPTTPCSRSSARSQRVTTPASRKGSIKCPVWSPSLSGSERVAKILDRTSSIALVITSTPATQRCMSPLPQMIGDRPSHWSNEAPPCEPTTEEELSLSTMLPMEVRALTRMRSVS